MRPLRSLALGLSALLSIACSSPAPATSCEIDVDANAALYSQRMITAHLVLRDAAGTFTAPDGRLEVWIEPTRGDRTSARCSASFEVVGEHAAGEVFYLYGDLPGGCAQPVAEGLPPFVADATFTPRAGAPVQCFGRVATNIGGDRPSEGDEPLRPPPPPPPPEPETPPAPVEPPAPPPPPPPQYTFTPPPRYEEWLGVPYHSDQENLAAYRSTRLFGATEAHVVIILRTQIVPEAELATWLEPDEAALAGQGVRVVSSARTTSAGAPGLRIDALSEYDGEGVRTITLNVLDDRRAYTLTCGSASLAYASWRADCERALRAFRIRRAR